MQNNSFNSNGDQDPNGGFRPGRHRFHAYGVALEIDARMGALVGGLRQRNRHLADQGDRASQSMVLNVAEGNRRKGRDRVHMFRTAQTSADEVGGVLDMAVGRRLVREADLVELRELLNRERAMLYRLINGRA